TSLTKPNATMSRLRPGYVTCRRRSRISCGVGTTSHSYRAPITRSRRPRRRSNHLVVRGIVVVRCGRQAEHEERSSVLGTLDVDPAAVERSDLVTEVEADAEPVILGGEERVEHALAHARG